MNLIEELKNYCEINNPVGALMLSGEWGSGKTYLIKSKFIPLAKDNYVFVCVSLFGIDSLDRLRVEVKKKWLEKAMEFVPGSFFGGMAIMALYNKDILLWTIFIFHQFNIASISEKSIYRSS